MGKWVVEIRSVSTLYLIWSNLWRRELVNLTPFGLVRLLIQGWQPYYPSFRWSNKAQRACFITRKIEMSVQPYINCFLSVPVYELPFKDSRVAWIEDTPWDSVVNPVIPEIQPFMNWTQSRAKTPLNTQFCLKGLFWCQYLEALPHCKDPQLGVGLDRRSLQNCSCHSIHSGSLCWRTSRTIFRSCLQNVRVKSSFVGYVP